MDLLFTSCFYIVQRFTDRSRPLMEITLQNITTSFADQFVSASYQEREAERVGVPYGIYGQLQENYRFSLLRALYLLTRMYLNLQIFKTPELCLYTGPPLQPSTHPTFSMWRGQRTSQSSGGYSTRQRRNCYQYGS